MTRADIVIIAGWGYNNTKLNEKKNTKYAIYELFFCMLEYEGERLYIKIKK